MPIVVGASVGAFEFCSLLGSAGCVSGAVGMRPCAGELAAINDQIFVADRPPSRKHSRISLVPAAYRACADRDVPETCGVMPCGMVRQGIVTLPRSRRKASAAQELSGSCDCGLPRAHRRSAKGAVRLG
jgi:hypothetical protein